MQWEDMWELEAWTSLRLYLQASWPLSFALIYCNPIAYGFISSSVSSISKDGLSSLLWISGFMFLLKNDKKTEKVGYTDNCAIC